MALSPWTPQERFTCLLGRRPHLRLWTIRTARSQSAMHPQKSGSMKCTSSTWAATSLVSRVDLAPHQHSPHNQGLEHLEGGRMLQIIIVHWKCSACIPVKPNSPMPLQNQPSSRKDREAHHPASRANPVIQCDPGMLFFTAGLSGQ